MRAFNNGLVVAVNDVDIHDFNSSWPGSNLRGLDGVTFVFESNGDLVDMHFKNGDVEEWDGKALVALSQDAQAYGESRRGTTRPSTPRTRRSPSAAAQQRERRRLEDLEHSTVASRESYRKWLEKRGPKPNARHESQSTMTYGTMPSREAFMVHFSHEVDGPSYSIRLSRTDSAAAEGTIIGDGDYDAEELYKGVKQLVAKLNDDGDDDAGDLASAILGTLGFEWV